MMPSSTAFAVARLTTHFRYRFDGSMISTTAILLSSASVTVTFEPANAVYVLSSDDSWTSIEVTAVAVMAPNAARNETFLNPLTSIPALGVMTVVPAATASECLTILLFFTKLDTADPLQSGPISTPGGSRHYVAHMLQTVKIVSMAVLRAVVAVAGHMLPMGVMGSMGIMNLVRGQFFPHGRDLFCPHDRHVAGLHRGESGFQFGGRGCPAG